jgi:Peptidase family M28
VAGRILREIVEKFGDWGDASHQKVVAGARASDVEQMALGVVDLLQVGLVAHALDPLLQRNDLVIAGHDGDGPKFQALGKMHRADRDVPAHRLDMIVEDFERYSRLLDGGLRAIELRRGPDEHAEFVRQQAGLDMAGYPDGWKAEVTIAGLTTQLRSTFPINDTVGTPPGGISARAMWVGLGTAADLIGRDLKDKAVFIYSIPTPGGRDHSAQWNGAIARVNAAGAALVFVIMGFPGDAVSNPEGAGGTRAPTFTISQDEGNAIRAALEQGQEVSVHLAADIKEKRGLKTGNVWGVLPGASDENILVMAHTDAFFEGALDNASGIAMMLEIARHYAAIPQSERRRTITFLTTSDHHHGSAGIKWVHDHMDDFFARTAVIVNCEHPSQTLMYLLDGGIMTANAVSARRWYVGGSEALKRLVTGSFKEFGVSVYAEPERRPGGELSQVFDKAPSFHIIDHVIYHTTIDTAALVPAWGMEDATRAFLKIIDGVNKMSLAQLRGPG